MNITRYRSTLVAAAATYVDNRLGASSGNATSMKTAGADSQDAICRTWIAAKIKGLNSPALTLDGQRKTFP
jgi:hypothetical protein